MWSSRIPQPEARDYTADVRCCNCGEAESRTFPFGSPVSLWNCNRCGCTSLVEKPISSSVRCKRCQKRPWDPQNRELLCSSCAELLLDLAADAEGEEER